MLSLNNSMGCTLTQFKFMIEWPKQFPNKNVFQLIQFILLRLEDYLESPKQDLYLKAHFKIYVSHKY